MYDDQMFMDRGGNVGPPMGGHHNSGPNGMIVTPQNQKYSPYAPPQAYGGYRQGPSHGNFFDQQRAQYLDYERDQEPDFGPLGRHHDRSHEDAGRYNEMLKPRPQIHLDDEDLQ